MEAETGNAVSRFATVGPLLASADSGDRRSRAQAHANVLVREHGPARASKMLGISVESLARLVAGLDVRNGTLAIVLEHERGEK